MHIPMPKAGIAEFLEVGHDDVEQFWKNNLLQRSCPCAAADCFSEGCSSTYDVLEFALSSGDLPVVLSRELAALWVFQLAEADEDHDFASSGFGEKFDALRRTAEFEGLLDITVQPPLVVTTLLASQIVLECIALTAGDSGACATVDEFTV